jgi:predicted RNase H-like HicB family nuclease
VKLRKFPVILTPGEDGHILAQIPLIPNCISQGASVEEALRNLREGPARRSRFFDE